MFSLFVIETVLDSWLKLEASEK